ncbi:MAG: hypothetical protein PWR24_550 [Desulfonauticus sp.]|nr:MAG: hypothetical protein XD41_0522 [Desulfonauticus sp. 38_4375]MDK2920993.1 hypothetical protein [Desulfonauticus sp.]
MEKLLQNLAEKLLEIDEASLTSLWEKYFNLVQNFQPTNQWERDFLVFSFIQSLKWKNQFFNLQLKKGNSKEELSRPNKRTQGNKASKVIAFPAPQKGK